MSSSSTKRGKIEEIPEPLNFGPEFRHSVFSSCSPLSSTKYPNLTASDPLFACTADQLTIYERQRYPEYYDKVKRVEEEERRRRTDNSRSVMKEKVEVFLRGHLPDTIVTALLEILPLDYFLSRNARLTVDMRFTVEYLGWRVSHLSESMAVMIVNKAFKVADAFIDQNALMPATPPK